MTWFFLAFIIVCILSVKLPSDTYNIEYLSKDNTTAIKGIFIVLVFFSHFNGYLPKGTIAGTPYGFVSRYFDQNVVTLFLFYSGYGVMESIKAKGNSYVSNMPVKRICKVLFQLDVSILLYALLNAVLGISFTGKQYLLSLIAWESIGNSNWYIFAIMYLYLATYISFKITKNDEKPDRAMLSVLVITLLYVVVLHVSRIKAYWWYDTVLCYPLGMLYSVKKNSIEKFLMKSRVRYLGVLAAVFAGMVLMRQYKSYIVFEVAYLLLFAVVTVLLSMAFSFKGRILQWCGEHLFEIFILMRIPMILMKSVGIADYNTCLYFVICAVITAVLAWIYKAVVTKLWNGMIAEK